MQAQKILLVAVAALACLACAQAFRCYFCVLSVEPKCGDPFDFSLKSVDAYGPVDLGSLLDSLLQNGKMENATLKVKELLTLFPKFNQPSRKVGSKPYCVKIKGTRGGVNQILRLPVLAEENEKTGCEAGNNNGVEGQVCVCDTSECNSASGLDVSFGLIAALALTAKLIELLFPKY